MSRGGSRRRRRERYRWRKRHVRKNARRRRNRGLPLAKPTYRTWLGACWAARRVQLRCALRRRPVPSLGVYPCVDTDQVGVAGPRHWHVGEGWRRRRRRLRVRLAREAARGGAGAS